MKGVKQVSTLGPASDTYEVIEKLFLAGTDVFRLNLSHGRDDKIDAVRIIRELETKYGRPIGILADLQGPKHRVGMYSKEQPKIELVKGQMYTFDLDSDTEGNDERVALPHPEVLDALQVGHRVLIDDGKLEVVVRQKKAGLVVTEVMNDAALSSRKGFNLPDTIVPGSAITPKDLEDLEFLMTKMPQEIDWIALSFVQEPVDMKLLATLIGGRSPAKLLAKIEKPSAVDNLKDIVDVCDGIMVARGDLGVEMLPEDVPVVQKMIIDECREQGTPVIVATQMLESMIFSPSPTRAECSDVATAIVDGADAVMLSGESAAGKYPMESVTMQQRVIKKVEASEYFQKHSVLNRERSDGSQQDELSLAAQSLANGIGAKAIVVFTTSGSTVQRAARLRPGIPIVAISPRVQTARYLTLCNNVYPAVLDEATLGAPRAEVLYRMITEACKICKELGVAESDEDLLVVTAGLPFGSPGAANVIRAVPAGGPDFSVE